MRQPDNIIEVPDCETPSCDGEVNMLYQAGTWYFRRLCPECNERVEEETQIHKDYTE